MASKTTILAAVLLFFAALAGGESGIVEYAVKVSCKMVVRITNTDDLPDEISVFCLGRRSAKHPR